MGTHQTNALLRFARRWFDERTVANVFEPLLADHQREWLDAAPSRRLRIATRTSMTFLVAMLTVAPRALLFTPTPASITRRVIARMIIFISVVTGLLMIPVLAEVSLLAHGELWLVLLWLLPGAVVVALPFAMGFAVDGIRRHATPTQPERIAMVRSAVVAVAFMTVFHGWVVPEANQQLRQTVWGDRQPAPLRGARELTTAQLFQSPWLARAEPARTRNLAIQREAHTRASFAILPALLMWMRWRALSRPSPRWLLPAWLAAVVTIGMYFGMRVADPFLESRLNLIPGVGAWIPLVAFVVVGVTRDHFARRIPV